jgi:Ni/Co efflux regulator RcnB
MKKYLLLFLLAFGISASSMAQSAGKGSGERSGSKRKARKQMQHFEKQKKDPNIKHNGTSYRRNKKSKYRVDGDGFSPATQKRTKRSKKSGVK